MSPQKVTVSNVDNIESATTHVASSSNLAVSSGIEITIGSSAKGVTQGAAHESSSPSHSPDTKRPASGFKMKIVTKKRIPSGIP